MRPAQSETPNATGHTLQSKLQYNNTGWKVYEDPSRCDGSLTFVPAPRPVSHRPRMCFMGIVNAP